jgi:hypothetical protein
MLRKAGIVAVSAALGFGASLGVAACGEDREGEVQIEGGTTGTGTTGTGTAGAETTGTGTAGTDTAPTETARTETTP